MTKPKVVFHLSKLDQSNDHEIMFFYCYNCNEYWSNECLLREPKYGKTWYVDNMEEIKSLLFEMKMRDLLPIDSNEENSPQWTEMIIIKSTDILTGRRTRGLYM